ncbi:MAG: FHA domain-containing protein [Prevotella sp.]|nr:FHA domain-containing protein [Prevotella sp.]MBR6714844.1 FHA domain-containing protein [Prevotella sp.]
MDIIFGREEKNSQLSAKVDNFNYLFDEVGSVPKTVSRQHCKMSVLKDGKFYIENLKLENETFVNGISIQKKELSKTDKIELGSSHYPLRWEYVDGVLAKNVNVSHLKKIWDDYQDKKLQQQIAERKFNTLKSATGLITMLAIVLNFIQKSETLYILLYVAAILISLGFTIKAYIASSKLPQEMQALTDKFQQEYQCPKCHHFLGSQSYDLLKQNKTCPHCKVNFDFQ